MTRITIQAQRWGVPLVLASEVFDEGEPVAP